MNDQKPFERANRISARNPLKYGFGSKKPSLDEAFSMTKKIAWGVSYVVGVLIFILISCEIFLRFLISNPQGYFVYPPHSVFRFVPDPVNTPGIEGVSHFVVNSLGIAPTKSHLMPIVASLYLAAALLSTSTLIRQKCGHI